MIIIELTDRHCSKCCCSKLIIETIYQLIAFASTMQFRFEFRLGASEAAICNDEEIIIKSEIEMFKLIHHVYLYDEENNSYFA